jgi:hypothetical protein
MTGNRRTCRAPWSVPREPRRGARRRAGQEAALSAPVPLPVSRREASRLGSDLMGLIIIGRTALPSRGCWCGLQRSFLCRLGRLLGRESGSCSAGGLLEPHRDLAGVIEQRPALPRMASVSARSLPTHASASSRRAAICSREGSSCSAASFCDPARISSASFVAFATCSSASALARSGWAPALTTMSAASAFVRAVISSASRRAPPVISSAVFRACWMMPFVCSLACSSACLTAASGERGRFELRDQAIDADDVGIDGRDRRRPRRRHRDAAGLSRRPAGGRPAEDAEEETEQPANGLRELAVVLEEASEELEDGDPRGPRRRGKDDDARRRGLMSEAFEHGGKARRPRDDAREFEVGFALTLLE